MSSFLIPAFAFLLLLAGSCSNKPAAPPPPIQSGPWSIDYKTSGGFVGVGKGSISVDSEGKFACSSNNRGEAVKGTTGNLNPRQLQPMSDAVAKLDRKGWNVAGLNVAAPDAFSYKLEFRTGTDLKELTAVQWYDNTAGLLPQDLKRLSAAVEETMKKVCVSKP